MVMQKKQSTPECHLTTFRTFLKYAILTFLLKKSILSILVSYAVLGPSKNNFLLFRKKGCVVYSLTEKTQSRGCLSSVPSVSFSTLLFHICFYFLIDKMLSKSLKDKCHHFKIRVNRHSSLSS